MWLKELSQLFSTTVLLVIAYPIPPPDYPPVLVEENVLRQEANLQLWSNLVTRIEKDGKLLQVITRDELFDLGAIVADVDQIESGSTRRGLFVKLAPEIRIACTARASIAYKDTEQSLFSNFGEIYSFAGEIC